MAEYQPMYDSFSHRRHERFVPTQRIRVACSVRLKDGDIDFETGQVKQTVQRRRTQADRVDEQRKNRREAKRKAVDKQEEGKTGWRVSRLFGIFVIALCLMIGGFSYLVKLSTLGALQNDIEAQRKTILSYQEQNAQLEDQIAAKSDQATIVYAATQELNMIRADGVEPIHLVAADPRPRQSAQNQHSGVSAQAEEETASTPVPALASN